MNEQTLIWTAILGMALVTMACRLGGYLLVSRHPPRAWVKSALNAVPGAVLTALITPALSAGPAEALAAAVTLAAAWRLPPLVAIAMGAATVVLLRYILPG